MKRMIIGGALILLPLIFIWALVIAEIWFSPPWVNLVVAILVIAFMLSGMRVIKVGQEALKEAKNG